MNIQIDNGKELVINENSWPDKISSLEIDNGKLIIQNNSDEIKILNFEKSVGATIKDKMVVNGKMIQISTASGEYGQTIDSPIKGHTIPAIWIETKPGSNNLEMWRCINGGSLDYEFSDFAPDEKIGKVFRYENDKIVFSDKNGDALIPSKDCKIFMPNIVISTIGGDSESSSAYIQGQGGGEITLINTITSNFNLSASGFSSITLKQTGSLHAITYSFISNLSLSNIVVANNSNYSSGLNVLYCSNVLLEDILCQSVKNYGIILEYISKPVINNIYGLIISRDSNTDYAIYINTVSEATLQMLNPIGGALALNNVNNLKITDVVPIDNVKLTNSSLNGQSNVIITDSDSLIIKNILIKKGAAAYQAPISITNSSHINIVGVTSEDDQSIYAIMAQVASNCKFSQFNIAGVKNTSNPIYTDNRNNNNTFQNIFIGGISNITFGGINTFLKNVNATDINVMDGAFNTIFAQLNNGSQSKLIVNFTQNNYSKVVEGEPKFLYGQGVRIKKGDIVDINIPFVIGGIQFTDAPTVAGGNDSLRVFFKIKTEDYESDLTLLTKNNLLNVNNQIKGKFFQFKIRVDGSALDDDITLQVNKIAIPIKENNFIYPIFYKKISLAFDKEIQSDGSAVFALMYANQYKNGIGIPLRDKKGNDIKGKVSGNNYLEFDYDFEFDNTGGRIPNKDFEVVAVLNSSQLTTPIQTFLTMTKNNNFGVTFSYKKDNAAEIILDTVNKG